MTMSSRELKAPRMSSVKDALRRGLSGHNGDVFRVEK